MLTLSIALALLAPLAPAGDPVVAGADGRKLDEYLTLCETLGFSGVVLVERKGARVLEKGYGLADPIEGTPNTPDTLYDIASASKQVTAAAVLLLEARGKLKVSDRLAAHLPGVPDDLRDITLAHLIHHTSGFPRTGPSGFGPDRDAAIAKYLSGVRTASAGERFEYWNGGYALLAAVVEVVAKEPFEDFVRDELFEPAGLERTTFIAAARDLRPLAVSHLTGEPVTGHGSGWEYRGMGGVLTTAAELARWCEALFGGRVVPRPQLAWMLEPDRENYAGGWEVFETDGKRKVVQHGGSVDAFESYVRWFPKDKVTLIVLTNRPGWRVPVTWGVSALLLAGEDPLYPPPPEPAKWKDKDFEPWLGAWRSADGQRLELARFRAGVRVRGIGGDVVAILTPAPPGPPGRSSPRARSAGPTADLEARALAIVDGLCEGDIAALSSDMASSIPPHWPVRVRDQFWPAHVERWGPLEDRRVLGAWHDVSKGQTRVWLRLRHTRAERSIEIAFLGSQLAIFDLKSPDWPVEAGAVPLEDELAGFDFTRQPPFQLQLERKDGDARLVLAGRDGTKIELERAR
jgi:CubicO group peptidase (beta-lactamase class C family)